MKIYQKVTICPSELPPHAQLEISVYGRLGSVVASANSLDNQNLGFTVSQPAFNGTLGELAYALRVSNVRPQDLDVLDLVQSYLTYFNEVAEDDINLASEALPMVARIVELKVRFLLPRPPKEDAEEEEELLEQALEAVTLLEELESAITFLRSRRLERRIMLPAKTPRPQYPRAERPLKISLGGLAELASRYSVSNYFEMAVERLTMAGAMKGLMKRLKSLRRGRLSELLEHQTWPVAAITFAGMLELFKEGKVRAEQAEVYGPIELELTEAKEERSAA